MRTTREKFPYTGYEIPMSDADTLPMTTSTDPAANAAVSTAIVDANSGVIITLTAAGNAQTIQDPTDTTLIRRFTVINNDTSTDSIVVNGITMAAGDAQSFAWDGSAWIAIASTYATTTTDGVVELATGAEAVEGTDALRAITPSTLTSRLAAPGDIGNTTPATSVAIDNLLLDANTLSSTTGDINITPKAGEDVVIDGHWEFDGPLVTAITDNDTTITAYTGKAISIESVTFDGGVATATTVNATTFDTNVAAAAVTLSGTTLAADGTDAAINISISPKGTGEVDISKVDIDGGAIDGTIIGANSAAAGTFTGVNVSGLDASRLVFTDGSKNLTNTGSTVETEYIPIGYAIDGASAPDALATVTSGTDKIDCRTFAGDADEDVLIPWKVPLDCDTTSGIKFRILCVITSATAPSTETWQFEMQGFSCGDGDPLDGTLGTAQTSNSGSRSDAQYDLVHTAWSDAMTSTHITDLAVGETVIFKLYRDVDDSDTYAQNVGVAGVELKYKRKYDATF